MTKCLVTGAAGFLGSHLVDCLIAEDHEVIALDNLQDGKIDYVNPKAEFVYFDLRRKNECKLVMKRKPEVIFHCAAYAAEGASVFNPIYTVEQNLIGFLNLFTSALNMGFETLVFTSSMAVYGKDPPMSGFLEYQPRQPVDPYGLTKADIEHLLEIYSKEFGFNYVIIRPHNVYGPRQSLTNPYRNVLGIWMNRIMHDKPPIIYGDGEQTRAFTYVEDCVPYIAKSAWTKEAYGEIFNVGSEEVHTLNEAYEIVIAAMKFRVTAAHPSLRLPIYEDRRPLEVKHAWCSSEKAKRILGYETKTTLKEGIAKMATWTKEQGPQPFVYSDQEFEIKKNIPKVWKEKQL